MITSLAHGVAIGCTQENTSHRGGIWVWAFANWSGRVESPEPRTVYTHPRGQALRHGDWRIMHYKKAAPQVFELGRNPHKKETLASSDPQGSVSWMKSSKRTRPWTTLWGRSTLPDSRNGKKAGSDSALDIAVGERMPQCTAC